RSTDDCGRCDNCTGTSLAIALAASEASEAARFIRGRDFAIEPRLRWPGHVKSGSIPPAQRLEPGRALARLGDGGWGDVVLQCKRTESPFPADLVQACADMIRHWGPEPSPAWITYVPSIDPARQLVPALASDLGRRLQLPVHPVLVKQRPTQPQKLMENSQMQLANIYGAFAVTGDLPGGPLLLIDDVSDSRWTLTYVASLLKEAGAGPVYPATLARSRG
ncbi:MAG: ComF family protein, partial [Candidatus Nanopelagicales bacterium]